MERKRIDSRDSLALCVTLPAFHFTTHHSTSLSLSLCSSPPPSRSALISAIFRELDSFSHCERRLHWLSLVCSISRLGDATEEEEKLDFGIVERRGSS